MKIIRPDVIHELNNAMFRSVIVDESTDTAMKEQMSVYVRFVHVEKRIVVEDFLEMKQIHGHPTATPLFEAMMDVFNPGDGVSLPLN